MTLIAIIWTVLCISLGAAFADDPKQNESRVLKFVFAACLLWAVGVVAWLVVGGVLEVVG